MAKRKSNKGRLELSSSIKQTLRGAGTSALIPDNIDEQIAINPEGLVKELSSHFAMIPIAQIEVNRDQPRREFEQEPLEELAESIKVHGIIQPITVRRLADKQYQIISGERRWRASQLAGMEEVPAFIRIANDQALMEMALIENIQREDLNPIEIAVSYQRLKDEFQLTDEELSERVGKKRTTITSYRNILKLHPDVIDALKKQDISMGHAKPISGIDDKLLQKEFLQQILDKELSVRRTENLARSYKPKKTKPKPKHTEVGNSQFALERDQIVKDFRAFFGHKDIKMEMEGKDSDKGQIVIQFKDKEQLHNLFKCIEQL
ncbi:MAG: ParB/RepB/Spo0J family partition protein [Saprospiraceae bacterium]|nr:ParB/RepB/Spo0J family partition protein [Lewinella sp.]